MIATTVRRHAAPGQEVDLHCRQDGGDSLQGQSSPPRNYDRDLYKPRRAVENFFAKLKQLRAIATRYDKTRRNFLAAVQLAAIVIWLD
jgi:transposase